MGGESLQHEGGFGCLVENIAKSRDGI